MRCREEIVALCTSEGAGDYPACACWTDDANKDTPSCKLWKQYVTGVTDPSLVNYQSLEALKAQYNLVSVDTTDLVRAAVARAQAQADASSSSSSSTSTSSSASAATQDTSQSTFKHPSVSSPYPTKAAGGSGGDSTGDTVAYGRLKHPGVVSPYESSPDPSADYPDQDRPSRRARLGRYGRTTSASEALRLSREALDDTGSSASGSYFRAIRDTLFG